MTSHYSNEQYHIQNTQIAEELFQSKYLVRTYQNAGLALYDIATGLQQYLAHRNYLGIVRAGSSLIENLMPLWLRQAVPLQSKSEAQSWIEYIETLNSETNFVVWSSENEITGEILITPEEVRDIHARLAKKRIFSIQITQQFSADIQLAAYSVLIIRKSIFEDNACLVVMTDKVKASSLIGALQNVHKVDVSSFKNAVVKDNSLQLSLIEKSLDVKSLYFQRFAMVPPRLGDRVILTFKDINAYALQQELGYIDDLCICPARYPFWVLDLWKNWWKEAENEALLRGLCVLPLNAFLNDPGLTQKIPTAVQKIRRLSGWNTIS